MSHNFLSLGIDLGGTKAEIALVDTKGIVVKDIKIPTRVHEGPEAVAEDIITASKNLIKESPQKVKAVGAGIAGQISSQGDKVLFAPNLNWTDIPLKNILEKGLDLPCVLLNDVRAATWGEWLHGAGKGCKDFICIFIGTGIGGGIVTNGHLMQGYSNTAGELGHTTLREGGRQCTCGNRGCLEAYAGGWGIAVTVQEAVANNPERAKKLLELAEGDIHKIKGEHLTAAHKLADPLAIEIHNDLIKNLAHGCVSFVNAFNPQKIIFGGSVALSHPTFIQEVHQEILRYALKAATAKLESIPAKLGVKANVIGAAAAATVE
ncbi:MAG: ROK family protein [Parachlamydiales bacterium]|jgi:glucokinase